MSISNRSLVAKAAVDSATLGTGGKMNPQQASQFITFMKDYSAFLRWIGFIEMATTSRDIDSLDVNKRAMRRALENEANAATGTVTTGRRRLDAIGVIMPYDITFQFMKENIEGKNINNTLARLFAQQFASDTVDLAFNGDSTSDDPFIGINDGWIKIATDDADVHKVDTEGSEDYIGKIFPDLLKSMPSKYFQLYQEEDKSKIKILCSHNADRGYKQQLTLRNTALGDSVLTSGKRVTYDGFEIVPVGFIPDGIYFAGALEEFLYGLYVGGIEVYHQVNPRFTRHEYTLLSDFDFQIKNPDAVVFANNLTA